MKFTLTGKNRATGEVIVVMIFENKAQVERFAVRCTFAESNPDVIYQVT
jgi:hypothetical protein